MPSKELLAAARDRARAAKKKADDDFQALAGTLCSDDLADFERLWAQGIAEGQSSSPLSQGEGGGGGSGEAKTRDLVAKEGGAESGAGANIGVVI